MFYFHNFMMVVTSVQEALFWNVILEMEYSMLYAAQWWHEFQLGNWVCVLPADTVNELLQRLLYPPLDPDIIDGCGQQSFSYTADIKDGVRKTIIELRNDKQF